MKRYLWMLNVGLILVAVVLAGVLVSQHTRSPVLAQSEMEVAEIIAIAGQDRARDEEPLFLIDTTKKVLMVYEYQIQTNYFALRSVRRFEADARAEKDVNFSPIGNIPKQQVGPSLRAVQEWVLKEEAK
ncbi:MAG: hypothetical protein AB1696_10885 [Planctomycetota bacterium]